MVHTETTGVTVQPALVVIAGHGRFPALVAQGARAAGCRVCILAIRDVADPGLTALAPDVFHWIPIARVGRWIRLARKFGADHLILAGGVRKTDAFRPWRIWRYLPDWRALRIWYRRARSDHRNLAILSALANELEEAGLPVENSVKYCPEALATDGLMTRTAPSAHVLADIEFGWPLALQLAALDIGQAIAVREKDVVAVEAVEGTDAMIERAGRLARAGWTLIKVAQTHQDMRFDVPTIGPQTIENLHRAHAAALVLEAKKTLILDREETLRLADKYAIAVIGRKP